MGSNNNKKGLVFIGMGFELVGIVIGGQVLGEHIDKAYELNGLGAGLVILLGMMGWIIHLIIMLKPFMAEAEEALKEDNDA